MQRHKTLQDNAGEQHLIKIRIALALVCIFVLLSIIFARFYDLQINQFAYYQTQSQLNRVQLQRIAPTRGLIFDREHRLIADNQPSYILALVRNRIKDMPATFAMLKNLKIVDDQDIKSFQYKLNRFRAFEAVPIRFNIDEETIAKVAANRIRLEGVEIKVNMVRSYPTKELLTHMLGYVGRINEKEMLTLDKDNYGASNHIGKIGIEKSYEDILHGTVGYEHVETNAHGEVLRTLERTDPIAGKNLTLHLDIDLQKVAYDALGESRGSVVAINAKTGGVLVAVSRPSYDPNLFVNGISFKAYKDLRESLDLPLFNRVLQAQYPPGSTIKPMMAIAGLEEKIVTPDTTVYDPGAYQLPGEQRFYRDWKRSGHGTVNLLASIEQSCDVYYYQLANKLGIKKIHRYYDEFGFGKVTNIDVPDERKGINPSPEWKRDNKRGSWYAGDTINIGIGQGLMLVTPLQLAYATSIIANRGERIIPQMVAKKDGVEIKPERLTPLKLKNEENWDYVIDGMRAVVHSPRGTAKGINKDLIGYDIAGKTGTAQVVGMKQGEKYNINLVKKRFRDHALFMGFAPIENPEIVIAVIVENGEHGSSTAAPVARKVFDVWMKKIQEDKKDD